MRSLACAGAGFLLAVLWFDLMFDVQALGHREDDVPDDVRASIAAYYARVTTAARPMNRLVAAAMLVAIGAIAGDLIAGELPAWRAGTALVLTLAAVGLAAGRTVGSAQRLGRRTDDAAVQSHLARAILHDHLLCAGAIALVLLLLLVPV